MGRMFTLPSPCGHLSSRKISWLVLRVGFCLGITDWGLVVGEYLWWYGSWPCCGEVGNSGLK